MAAAHFTIDVRFIGAYRHRYCGLVAAFAFSCDPDVIHLAFGEE
jgi:hypothetical protein